MVVALVRELRPFRRRGETGEVVIIGHGRADELNNRL